MSNPFWRYIFYRLCNYLVREICWFVFQKRVFPWSLWCLSAILQGFFLYCIKSLSNFLLFSWQHPRHADSSSPLQVGRDRNVSIAQVPQKLKCWIHIPLFSFPSKKLAIIWVLLKIATAWGRNWHGWNSMVFLIIIITVHGFELIWGTMTSYLISGVPIKACGVINFCQWTVSVEGHGLGLPILPIYWYYLLSCIVYLNHVS